ncbi:hypothetical protein OG754_31565 [Streptomyces decoyicus]|nr:hypothetical protein [Streptomyces decoyicus]
MGDFDKGVSWARVGVRGMRWETPRRRNAGVRRVRRTYAEVADGPREA